MLTILRALAAALLALGLAGPALAQGVRFQTPSEQFLNANGVPYVGGQLFFYESGTSTPATTYSNSGLSIANPNPVILDGAGRAGNVFLTPGDTYKVVLEDSLGNQVWTADPVSGVNAGTLLYSPPFANAVTSEPVATVLANMPTPRDFVNGAQCNGTTDDTIAFSNANALGYFSVPPGDCLINASQTISANVLFLPGSEVRPGNGFTLHFTGAVLAPANQICDISAGGACDFSNAKITSAPVEWWGAKADAQNVTNGAVTGTTLTSASTPFKATDVGKAVTIAGAGSAASVILATNATGGISNGTRVLPVASNTGVVPGLVVSDVTHAGIPVGTLVEAVDGDNILLSNWVNATGVTNGDVIRFSNFATDLTTTITGYTNSGSVTVGASAPVSVANASVWWGTDNTGAITDAFAGGPYLLTVTGHGCYQVSGLTYSEPNHRLLGSGNYDDTNCIVGPGLPFAHEAAISTDMLAPFHNYVLQNGTANSAGKWVFDNIRVLGSDLTTTIACGTLTEPTQSLVWDLSLRDTNCQGYVGWQLQWWNAGEISGNIFTGTFAGLAKTLPASVPSGGAVEKLVSNGDGYFQSGSPTSGYCYYEQIGSVGAYTAITLNFPAVENCYDGMRIVGAPETISGLHIERVVDTIGGSAVTDSGGVTLLGIDFNGLTSTSQVTGGLGNDVWINNGGIIIFGVNVPVIFGSAGGGPELFGGAASPNGTVSAKQGSLFLDMGTPEIWKNCSGSTTWVNITSGAC